jgi:SNF2 family DNA or RNA helicase
MGLGKTVQAIAVLLDRREVGPTLIVAPVSVGFNWMREIERFAPTLNPILYRDTDRSDFLKTLKAGDLLITSYHLLQQHVTELSGVQWGTLVLDEAQAIKNSQTKTSQAVREIQADWRLALTGTPAENHLGDLWSLFRGISPGILGSWERFREVFADPIEKTKDVARKQALSRVIRPFILRRTKSEVLTELPARTEIQLTAELSKEERRLYEDARMWAVTNLTNLVIESDKDQRFQVLAALTKLRQLACHPRLVDKSWELSSAKLDLFLETIDELREGRHRALVFSQFTQHLALVREALDKRKIQYQYLDGSTTVKKRQAAVDAFQKGEGELFLISLKAGGTGLNLTGADYVVHLDPWWNPAVEDQATDRAHRIGQKRPVTVYRLVAKDTIEEQILKLHADKRGLVAGILEGTDAAAKLSTTELVDLIKLGGQVK